MSDAVLLDTVIATPAEMVRLGARIASWLRAGDVVLLEGPLGAGKTTFTRGLGAALGVRGAVTSPTFVIARVHPGPLPLVHVDAYRVGSWLELQDLDLDHDLADAVTVVEWGTGVAEGLSERRLEIAIRRREGEASDVIEDVVDVDADAVVDHDPRHVVVTARGGFEPAVEP